MIRHVVLFRFAPDHDPALVERWSAGLDGLVGAIPGLRSLAHGRDVLGAAGRSWDHAIVADFDALDDVRGYATHEAHRPLIELSAAFCDEIASVDLELATEGVAA